MNLALPTITVGWIIALLVLSLAIVFAGGGQLDYLHAGLIGGLAVARLRFGNDKGPGRMLHLRDGRDVPSRDTARCRVLAPPSAVIAGFDHGTFTVVAEQG